MYFLFDDDDDDDDDDEDSDDDDDDDDDELRLYFLRYSLYKEYTPGKRKTADVSNVSCSSFYSETSVTFL